MPLRSVRVLLLGLCTMTALPANEPQPAPKIQSAFDRAFTVPEMTPKRSDAKPFEYVDVGRKIPNYTPGRAGGRQGEPFNMMQKPVPPEESLKHMVVPRGFHVELFASEADFGGGKPICMNWDERGRLWVALTYDYPNELQQPVQGRDRILICEDTNGDGRADKCTIFAEKLSIPTSMMFHKGGLIVFDAGQTVYLKDTDGDGRADLRQVLFGNWNMRDTHGTVSNMQYGLDNWIYAMQGYNRSRVTAGGETHTFAQGFWRLRPDASKVEFLRSTDNNTWGLGISEEGILFGSTANRNPSVYMPIPNRYYEGVRGWTPSLVLRMIADTHRFNAITDKVRQVDQHGGYTAAAGHSLYTARRYPPEYWNRTAFVTEPTGHLVGTFVIRRDGSHFRDTNSFNLLASDDEWTSPIMAEVGPDGNVWVIDWYNFIVQHNPTPAGFRTGKGAAYETELRDKKLGRIYRVVYDGAPDKSPRFTLEGATPQKLVETLKNDNLFWRRHAQRLLVEGGQKDVVPALLALARDTGVDEIGLNVSVIHALWTLHGLGALDGSNAEATTVTVAALRHPSAGVRRNAVQTLPRTAESATAILDAGLLRDGDPQVRLLALLALADQPATEAAGKAIVAALNEPQNTGDRWIPDAATAAAAKNSEPFLRAMTARQEPSDKLLAVAAIISEHYARSAPVDSIGAVVGRLVEADPKVGDAIVRGLAKGWPTRQLPKLDERLESDLEKLAARIAPERRGLVIKLASLWGSKRFDKYTAEVTSTLLAKAQTESLGFDARIAAARELVGTRPTDARVVQQLLDLITPRTPPDIATGLLGAVQLSEDTGTGKLVLQRLPGLTPAIRAAGMAALLSRPEWTRALLDAANEGTVKLTDLTLDQRRSLTEHPDPRIGGRARNLLARGGALPNSDRQKVIDELISVTKAKGKAEAGKLVFKDQCAKCHVHGSEGTRIGPDLTGMAVHTKEHLIVEMLDPSRSVEANFRIYTVITKNGQVRAGLLASESRTAIELFDAEGKKHTILRSDIEEMAGSAKSLMPDGFEKQVTREQLTDLLEFLTQRGKYVALPLEKAATAVSTRGLFTSEDVQSQLAFDSWGSQTFAGVPFQVIDPRGDQIPNVILLNGPQGRLPPTMPRSVTLPCNMAAKAIHLLSGVSVGGFPHTPKGSVSLIIRLHYSDGKTEEHPLKNGERFADFARRVDVPGSQHAYDLKGKQVRYLVVHPARAETIKEVEFVKGPDNTAPIVMAVTVEAP